jgi:hypothetical protein
VNVFWHAKLYQKTGGAYVRTQNWHVLFDRSNLCVPPVRPVWSKTTKYNLASPLDRPRRVYKGSYVERPNRSPDEGDTTYTRSARRVHRSDRCPLSEPKKGVLIDLGL